LRLLLLVKSTATIIVLLSLGIFCCRRRVPLGQPCPRVIVVISSWLSTACFIPHPILLLLLLLVVLVLVLVCTSLELVDKATTTANATANTATITSNTLHSQVLAFLSRWRRRWRCRLWLLLLLLLLFGRQEHRFKDVSRNFPHCLPPGLGFGTRPIRGTELGSLEGKE
jgi:hypothetical protein